MDVVATGLVAAYAALNAVLAWNARAAPVPGALFALAAAAPGAAAAASTWLVAFGLVLGSCAPLAYGKIVRGRIRLSHHVVRAVAAAVVLATWLAA